MMFQHKLSVVSLLCSSSKSDLSFDVMQYFTSLNIDFFSLISELNILFKWYA